MAEPVRAVAADGTGLVLSRFPASGTGRGVCLLTHAMVANARTFGSDLRPGLGHHLAAQGIECFALDFRGHGASVPPHPRGPGGWCFDDYVELDLPAAVRAVCTSAGIKPEQLAYLGHSLGGLVGVAGIGTGVVVPPRRLALLAVSVWLPGPGGSAVRRGVMTTARAVSRVLGFVPARALRLGSEDEPRGYVEQMTTWAESGRWTSRAGVDYLAAAGRVSSPVLAAVGAADRLCRPADAGALLAALPAPPALRLVGRAHGDGFDPDHMGLVTRPELARFWTDLAHWLRS